MKHPRITITLILFSFWFLFNRGKMTALGLFGGEVGLMFSGGTTDVVGGILVHVMILTICGFLVSFFGKVRGGPHSLDSWAGGLRWTP